MSFLASTLKSVGFGRDRTNGQSIEAVEDKLVKPPELAKPTANAPASKSATSLLLESDDKEEVLTYVLPKSKRSTDSGDNRQKKRHHKDGTTGRDMHKKPAARRQQ